MMNLPPIICGRRKALFLLKVDKGLADLENGVQMMKPIPDLNDLLKRAVDKHIFGTKCVR